MKLKINSHTETTTRTDYKLVIDNNLLIRLLQEAGAEIPDTVKVKVFVDVPGGGDWDIDKDMPITVCWSIET